MLENDAKHPATFRAKPMLNPTLSYTTEGAGPFFAVIRFGENKFQSGKEFPSEDAALEFAAKTFNALIELGTDFILCNGFDKQ